MTSTIKNIILLGSYKTMFNTLLIFDISVPYFCVGTIVVEVEIEIHAEETRLLFVNSN